MSEKTNLIYDLLKEVREDQKDLKETSYEHRLETKDWQSKTDQRMQRIEEDLKYHIKRTDVLEDLHMSNEGKIGANSERISELEEPKKVLSLIKKWIIGAGAIAGALFAIAKFTGLF